MEIKCMRICKLQCPHQNAHFPTWSCFPKAYTGIRGVFHRVVTGGGIQCHSGNNLDHTICLKKIDFNKINTHHRFPTRENFCPPCIVTFVYFAANLLSHPVGNPPRTYKQTTVPPPVPKMSYEVQLTHSDTFYFFSETIIHICMYTHICVNMNMKSCNYITFPLVCRIFCFIILT